MRREFQEERWSHSAAQVEDAFDRNLASQQAHRLGGSLSGEPRFEDA